MQNSTTAGAVSGVNIVVGLGLSFVNQDTVLVIFGVTLGYLAGVWVGAKRSFASASLRGESCTKELVELSDRVRAIADEPERFIEAIKAYQEESGVGLAAAKSAIETYLHRDRTQK